MSSPQHTPIQFSTPDIVQIERQRNRYRTAELAPATTLSYEHDWRVFEAWCRASVREALPASRDTVELYVTDLIGRGRKVTTLERHVAGIQYQHRRAGYSNPCGPEVRKVLAGARRILCQDANQKEALSTADLARIVEATRANTAIGARNRAVLLFGFASALRRSNLARLVREDLLFTDEGLLVTVRHEKQDRIGRPRIIAVASGKHAATCPVRALRRWLEWRGDGTGPLFCRIVNGYVQEHALLGNRIAQIVQEAAASIGLDRRLYGAHSLRAGFVTEALENGAGEILVARHTGHKDLATLRGYFRGKSLFRRNAGRALGL